MAKIKIKFLGIPNKKRFYYDGELSCDTQRKETCFVEVSPEKAARLMVDFPNEWEHITRKGAEVIGKEITEYRNKIIANVESTKGVIVVEKNGNKTKVEPTKKPKSLKKPAKKINKPKEKK